MTEKDWRDRIKYLCVRNVLELSDIGVGVIKTADECSSPSGDHQVAGGVGAGRERSASEGDKGQSPSEEIAHLGCGEELSK